MEERKKTQLAKNEESTVTVANSTKLLEEPQTKAKEKSERSWWRKTDPQDTVPHPSPDLPKPTTPTSPTLPLEKERFDFVLPSKVKLLTLNDVFKTPNSITWTNQSVKTVADVYKDTITVSWDQTIESKRVKPNYPHLQKQKHQPSGEKDFIGKKQRDAPQSTRKNGGVGSFIPRKDAQEFRPQTSYPEYHQRSDDYYSSKRPVKADSHHLPSSNNDMHYNDYVDRGKYFGEYPSSRSGRERHQPQVESMHGDHHYPHAGYSDPRSYRDEYARGDPSREQLYSRQYDRESVARVYYDKERLYHQNSHLLSREPKDRRHTPYNDMSSEDHLSRYEQRRRRDLEEQNYYHRDRYTESHRSSDRINNYDEYERVVAERHRRQLEERRRSRMDEYMHRDAHREDPRWQEYYRMRNEMRKEEMSMRRHRQGPYG
jgi:hypothetical protein